MSNLNWTDLIKLAYGIDIVAAASEAKKNALMKKYGLTINDVNMAAEIDPTPNGQYTEWVCREMHRGNLYKWTPTSEADTVVTRCLNDFTRLKQSPEFLASCKEGKFVSDIMKMEFNDLYDTCKEARQLMSRNQQEKDLIEASKLWTGEYVGNANTAKVEVFLFDEGEEEAYSLVSSGPALDPTFNPTTHTAWCTTQEDTAREYLTMGEAYIIRVNGKNFCNLHEASHQCMDANNRSMANVRTISNPIVQFACKGANIKLEFFVLGDHTCYLCHKPYVTPVVDTREGREGKIMCFTCFHKDWTSEIKRYIMQLYNANPDAFNDEPTTRNMKEWVMDLWDVDGDEHERNFWNPEDVEDVLKQLKVIK